mmetsp:Transcript_7265/g.32049  ORF Transcript_7265/g.32049 Transcript_7265/m.32049 type:complete len:208 (+) Transcript_7265:321-944(+)
MGPDGGHQRRAVPKARPPPHPKFCQRGQGCREPHGAPVLQGRRVRQGEPGHPAEGGAQGGARGWQDPHDTAAQAADGILLRPLRGTRPSHRRRRRGAQEVLHLRGGRVARRAPLPERDARPAMRPTRDRVVRRGCEIGREARQGRGVRRARVRHHADDGDDRRLDAGGDDGARHPAARRRRDRHAQAAETRRARRSHRDADEDHLDR